MTLTFTDLELLHLSTVTTVVILSGEMKSSRISKEVDTKIMYAIMSGCESASFYFSDKELISLNQKLEIALRSGKIEEIGLCDAIHEKVAYEIRRRKQEGKFI